ncbi:proline dipeptidase [Mesoplasma entomophilum]|uniref:IMPACT family protein n=1 Tax=Mesoplasma entomophilum TaxID=2149 RepID=UPI000D042760|nr:YigZ family protein [Mesoplasma entomophilum]AVN60077.1 proline dipeptidase [Mesoplasma entomophilum]
MKTIKSKILYSETIEIKKSKFICHAVQVNSKEELDQFIKDFSANDARHNCYAYKIGSNTIFGGYNDDGEPKGTAGKPIFNVIEKNDLTNICILVTRYFGGIKLGAGPLTRAYTSSAASIVKKADFEDIKQINNLSIYFKINNIKEIESFLNKNNIEIINKKFEDTKCIFDLNASKNQIEDIIHLLN